MLGTLCEVVAAALEAVWRPWTSQEADEAHRSHVMSRDPMSRPSTAAHGFILLPEHRLKGQRPSSTPGRTRHLPTPLAPWRENMVARKLLADTPKPSRCMVRKVRIDDRIACIGSIQEKHKRSQ